MARLQEGTKVEARFGDGADWYDGIITATSAGGTYSIAYDDGEPPVGPTCSHHSICVTKKSLQSADLIAAAFTPHAFPRTHPRLTPTSHKLDDNFCRQPTLLFPLTHFKATARTECLARGSA
jgi:hypothetical protein